MPSCDFHVTAYQVPNRSSLPQTVQPLPSALLMFAAVNQEEAFVSPCFSFANWLMLTLV